MHTPLDICASALRGLIIPSKGKKLVIADLSNIEGRVLAWLVGESWKIKAFKDFDNGQGHDLYKLTYSKTFGIPVDKVDDDMRQVGKVMELAFGYQGGVGAWITFATAYGLDLDALAEKAYDEIPPNIMREAENFIEWAREQGRSTYGLADKTFIVCDAIKRLWREGHPSIRDYWGALETTTKAALEAPGKTMIFGMHKIRKDGSWLRISLPSGRCLCYPKAEITDGKITYEGTHQFSRKWTKLGTYGGKLSENITQATARDILVYGGMLAEKHGYKTVLSVHDELLTVTPDTSDYTPEGLSSYMTSSPPWAYGLPLAAKGFEAYRYRK